MEGYEALPPVCVIGSRGFLGTRILEACTLWSTRALGFSRSSGNSQIDLRKPCLAGLPLDGVRYAFITAGVTRLAQCESNPDAASVVNVKGTLKLIRLLLEKNIHPIFFSSDCVFDGKKGQYLESDTVNPLNVYGQQKVEVEQKMRELCSTKFTIIRISKVYSCYKGDGTLIDEIVTSLQAGKILRLAYDQIFSPVHVRDLLSVIFYILQKNIHGIIHIPGPQAISRYNLGLLIADKMKLEKANIQRISLAKLGEAFERPKNTSLGTERVNELLPRFSSIGESVDEYMQQ